MQIPQLRTPSGHNGAAPVVAHGQAKPGLRVSTLSNLDSTRRRVVKRGCVVEFPGGCTARVARVRLGFFCADVATALHPCSSVKVVA